MEQPANQNPALKGNTFYDTLYRNTDITIPTETGTDPYRIIPKSLLFTLRDNPFQEGIRTQRWKYIRFYKGKGRFMEADIDFKDRTPALEMLFDLEADPGERNNLAAIPEHTEILHQLRTKTAAESIAINQRRATYMKTTKIEPRFDGKTDQEK